MFFLGSETVFHYFLCLLMFILGSLTLTQSTRKLLISIFVCIIFINFRLHEPETDVQHIINYSALGDWNILLTKLYFQREFLFWYPFSFFQSLAYGQAGVLMLDLAVIFISLYLLRNIRVDTNKLLLISFFLISGFFIIQANNGIRQFYSTLILAALISRGSNLSFLPAMFIHNIGIIGFGFVFRNYKVFALLGALLIYFLTQFSGDLINKSVGTRVTGLDLKPIYILAQFALFIIYSSIRDIELRRLVQFFIIFGIFSTILLVGTITERLAMFSITLTLLVIIFNKKPIKLLMGRLSLISIGLFLFLTTFFPATQSFLS